MKKSFWTSLFDVISPRTCAVCGTRLSPRETAICVNCHLHLPLTLFETTAYDNPMARLFWGVLPVERAAALFYYEPRSEAGQIIYDMKYHGQAQLAEAMGHMTARLFAAHGFFEDIDALVPVPLTWKRRWHRGYNQSEQIAEGISRHTRLPVYKNVVKRISFTESQTRKNAWERQENVEDAFRLANGERIKGKHLLVVDDVVTTGATIKACAKELCKAGDVRISILSLGFTKS